MAVVNEIFIVFNKIEKVLKQHPLLLSLLINLLFIAIVYSFYMPRFQTNDDVGMMLNVAGVSRTLDSCPYLIHSHYFIGAVLKFLYSFGVSIPWYGMYLLTMVFLSHVTFLYIALKSNPRIRTIFVFTLYLLLIGLELLINLQFTISSGLIGFAGMSLLIFLRDEKEEGSKAHFVRWSNVLALVFLALCVMIRWEGFLMVCTFAMPILLFSLIGKSRRRIVSRLSVLAVILITCIGLDQVNRIIWTSSEEWSEFFRFNELRSKFHGNNPLDYLELDELDEVLESVDWSRNDYYMFQCFYFLDNDVYNSNKLRTLLDAVPTFKEVSLSQSLLFFGRICSNELVLCAFIIFLMACVFNFRDRRKLFILVLSLLTFPSVVFFLIYYLRPPPPRVYFTMAVFVSMIPLMVYYGPAINSPQGSKKRSYVRIALGAICLTLVLFNASSRFAKFNEQSERTVYNNNSIHAFMDLVAYRYPDKLFITWAANFYWEYVSPFESLGYLENFSTFNIGTSQLKPSNLELLEKYGVSDLMTDLVERDDILLITHTNKVWNKDLWFRTYLKEHRNIRSQLVKVYETKRFMINEVRAIN